MNTRLFFAIPFAILSLAGCAEPTDEPVSSQAGDLVAPFWSGVEADTTIDVTVEGGGDVPVASQCAPGSVHYRFDTTRRWLQVAPCNGAPLRVRAYGLVVSDREYTAIIAAARGLAHSEVQDCTGEGIPASFVSILGTEGPSLSAMTDRYACFHTHRVVSGLEQLVAVLGDVRAAHPEGTYVFEPLVESTSGARFWKEGTNSFSLTVTGSGPTAVGSSCIQGTVFYSLLTTPAPVLYVHRCDAPDPAFDPRSRMIQLPTVSGPALEKVIARLKTLAPSREVSCDSNAAYLTGDFNTSKFLLGDTNGCAIDTDRGPFADLESVRKELEEAIAAP